MYIAKAIESIRSNITLINMLEQYGDFGTDSDGDGLADGLSPGGGASEYTFTEGVQRLTAISESAKQFYAEFTSSKITFTWDINDVIYFCGWVRAISGTAKLGLYNRKADGSFDTVVSAAISNNEWTFVSIELTVSSKYSTPILYARIAINSASGQSSFVGSGEKIEVKKCILINKTKMFGLGNELTKAQMDTFVQSNPTYFTQRDYMKV